MAITENNPMVLRFDPNLVSEFDLGLWIWFGSPSLVWVSRFDLGLWLWVSGFGSLQTRN
jgi:hypothetical protein